LAGIVVFFLIGFLVYAVADLVAWRAALIFAIDDIVTEGVMAKEHAKESEDIREVPVILPIHRFNAWWLAISKPTSVLKAIYEFALPVVIGIYAVLLLLRAW